MLIKKKYRKSVLNIIVSTICTLTFSYFILAADKYNIQQDNQIVKASFIPSDYNESDWYIPLNNIIIESESSDKFTYIVQPWDTLSYIAYNFWTTTENIRNTNKLKNDNIKPWDKLIISEDEWFIFQIENNISLNDFAQKYSLDVEKLKELNYISDGSNIIEKGDEIFLPISYDKAKLLWIIKIEQPKPEIKEPKITQKPIEKKEPKKTTPKKETKKPIIKQDEDDIEYNGKSIVAQRYYRPSVQNWFYLWQCTRYVAIKKFPYLSKWKQERLWWGNWKDWYQNAKDAWYKVWSTPKEWSIVVLRYWGRRYYYYWHVWIVQDIDWDNRKILIEDMNAVWRFIVTKRWIDMDSKIIWYIYQ